MDHKLIGNCGRFVSLSRCVLCVFCCSGSICVQRVNFGVDFGVDFLRLQNKGSVAFKTISNENQTGLYEKDGGIGV